LSDWSHYEDFGLPKLGDFACHFRASDDRPIGDEVNGLSSCDGSNRLMGPRGPTSSSMSVANRSAGWDGRMIERAGEAAGLAFPVHVHMLDSTGYALAARAGAVGMRSVVIEEGWTAS
jgi:hypothetical protein